MIRIAIFPDDVSGVWSRFHLRAHPLGDRQQFIIADGLRALRQEIAKILLKGFVRIGGLAFKPLNDAVFQISNENLSHTIMLS